MMAVSIMGALAMENWGLIIYAEQALIYNPMVHPLSVLEEVVMTVSHELAHQVGWLHDVLLNVDVA